MSWVRCVTHVSGPDLGKVVRPGGFELPTFWFVGLGSKILTCFLGVVYEPEPLKTFLNCP